VLAVTRFADVLRHSGTRITVAVIGFRGFTALLDMIADGRGVRIVPAGMQV
jgi:hypothetical protein